MFFRVIQGSILKHALTLLTFSSLVASAVTNPSFHGAPNPAKDVGKRYLIERDASPEAGPDALAVSSVPSVQEEQNGLVERSPAGSAGLAWGPIYLGNLKLYLTNPHTGFAGPKFQTAPHVNFHVDRQRPAPYNDYKPVVNMHIVRYQQGESSCLYVWDSVTDTTVFDSCFDDYSTALSDGVDAIKNFVDSLLRNADTIASIAIIAALVVALAAAIAGLGVVVVA